MIFRIQTHLLLTAALALAEDKVTFDDDVFPIFQQSCLNCHNPDKTRGGLDLSTYAAALRGGSGGKIAEAGDTGSKLLALVHQTAEPIMPPEGEKLANVQIATLTRWIEGGLLENKNSAARKPAKPKFATALRSDPAAKPDGPPPMPEDLLLDPPVITESATAVRAIAVSPWAPLLAVTSQRQVLLHHTDTLELAGILPFPEGEPTSLSFTPDARYLIVGGGVAGKSGLTVTFDVITGARLLTAGREFDSVLAADLHPSFSRVATGGPSRLLKIWDTNTGEAVHSVKKHTDWITALDISPDGVLLASGDRNGGVWVWESGTAREFHTLRGHQAGITGLGFRADSNVLATASEDGTLRFWEMNGGQEIGKADAHPGGVTAFAFALNGTSVSAGRDRKVRLWKEDFTPLKELAKDLPALPTAVALDAEGKRAFIADSTGRIHVFDTADAKSPGVLVSNPPSIATRLEAIASELAEITTKQKAIRETIASHNEEITAAENALKTTEDKLRQAREIRKAAADGESEARAALENIRQTLAARRSEGTGDSGREQEIAGLEAEEKHLAATHDGAARAAAAADARIGPAEAAASEARKAAESSAASLAGTTAALAALEKHHAELEKSQLKWRTADINTHTLKARTRAGELAMEAEDRLFAYHEALARILPSKEALNTKRDERRKLAKLRKSGAPDDGMAQEINATLAALDTVVSRMNEAHRALEAEALELREAAGGSLPRAHRANQEADDLKHRHHQAKASLTKSSNSRH